MVRCKFTAGARLYDLQRTYEIDPARIRLAFLGGVKTPIQERGRIVGGDWDLNVTPFDQLDVYKAFEHRFLHGGAWADTPFYRRMTDLVASGRRKGGCRTKDEYDARLRNLEVLFNEIKTKGYREQRQTTSPWKPWGNEDEIHVHIGRDGDYIFADGRHRLCIAKLLGLPQVPVKISRRHAMWVALRKEILAYAKSQKTGKVYSPLPHPDLADIPSAHGNERMEIIEKHVPPTPGRMLDIGAHWGYFCHRFEDLGYECIAVEDLAMSVHFMKRLARAENRRFKIIEGSVLSVDLTESFDVVLALNIFHHLIKTKELHEALVRMLGRLNARVMFFEPHLPTQRMMAGAFRNYPPQEFLSFVKEHGRFKSAGLIGTASDGRPIFKLER